MIPDFCFSSAIALSELIPAADASAILGETPTVSVAQSLSPNSSPMENLHVMKTSSRSAAVGDQINPCPANSLRQTRCSVNRFFEIRLRMVK